MSSLNVQPLQLDKVSISLLEEESGARLVFDGIIDMREPGIEISPYLAKIHDALIFFKEKTITIDFTLLEFMNSSGIKTVITWIMRLNDLANDERYQISIRFNPDITWQESSVHVMKQLFPDLISLEMS